MRVILRAPFIGAAAIIVAHSGAAQTAPVVRQIGRLERVAPDSLGFKSVSMALAMPGGRVMVNDIRGRRVVMLDSTLSRATPIADTTSTTSNAYGASWATLIRYRGDSALLMVPSTLSMFVFAPNGSMARVVAMPRPNEAQQLALASPLGMPAIDARGRLVYFGTTSVGSGTLEWRRTEPWLQNGKPTEAVAQLIGRTRSWISPTLQRTDSGAVTRIDFTTRVLDTAVMVHVSRFKREVKIDDAGFPTAVEVTPDPLPVLDQWTVLRDGTIAIVRGSDYHIDWIDAAGRMSSTPKMPFDWQRVADAQRAALIDSAIANWQPAYQARIAQGYAGGRGGSQTVRNVPVRAAPTDLPDYYPAFGARGVTSDWDGNVWIRTTKIVGDRPVYDVVNRRGEIIDRVQLPPFRTIAGFGPAVIYMAVKDNTGLVHLERARLR